MPRRALPQVPAVLSLGVFCQIAQILFLRELLMVFHGNELSIGVILASWMVWVGVGSRLGAFVVERYHRPLELAGFASAGTLVLLPASVVIIRGLRGFFDVVPGAYLSLADMALSCFILMAPVCLVLGAQFVFLVRLWREADGTEDTSGAEKTYIWEALGNIIGGVLFTFVMVHYLNAFQSAVLAGMLMAGTVLWLARKTSAQAAAMAPGRRIALSILLFAGVAGYAFLSHLDTWAYRLQWKFFAPEHTLVETRQSKYGTIAVLQREDQYSFFQSGHLVFSTAGPETPTGALEEQEGAVFAHFSMAQHRNPERILLIGGGLRGSLREIARHPIKHIDYIELDPVLTEAALPYVPQETRQALESPRVRLLHTDGRLFVKSSQDMYDMILVDIPDPATAVLNRYYTEEFFREAVERLNPDGVLVIGVVSTAGMRGSAVANRNATIYHTLKSVFDYVLPAGERFLYLFASNEAGQVSADIETLRQRYLSRDIDAEGFSHRHYDMLLEESPLRRTNWIIRHHGRSPTAHLDPPDTGPLFPGPIDLQDTQEADLPGVVRQYFINSDFKPVGYYHTLVFWNVLTRAEHGRALRWILRVEPWWIAPVAGAALAVALLLRMAPRTVVRRAHTHYAVLFAVFTTGLSTMALQIALLFTFQSVYGFVYEMVGMIVAIFMGGLAMGTTITHRFVVRKANMRILAAVQLSVALFAGVLSLVLPGTAAARSPVLAFVLFSGMTFGAGLFNGADFPLATACLMGLTGRPEKATGIVYGVELFGACAGALLASVVVAPVMGIVACCLLAAIANGTAFLVILLSGRHHEQAQRIQPQTEPA